MRTLAGPWAASPAAASTCYPSPAGPVRLALVLSFALCPAVAAAQGSQYPAQQGTASPGSEQAPVASKEGPADRGSRVLVVDCPTRSDRDGTSADEASDSDSTVRALIAALCARGHPPSSSASIRHLLAVPRDVSNTPHDEPEEHAGRDEATPSESGAAAEPQFRVHLFADVKFSAIDSTG